MGQEFAVDEQEVEKIVETMKKKYREEGVAIDEVSSSLKELRGIITEDTYSRVDIESQEDIEGFGSKYSKTFGNIYLKLKSILQPIQKVLKNFPLSDEIGYYLYSANMHYSANQYLALASAAGFVTGLVALIIGLILGALTNNIFFMTLIAVVMGVFSFFLGTMLVLLIPKQKASARGNACSAELPFALRHMSTELRAGIGLYKTLQAIAATDYGVLSEEFARTINEIEEGTDTSVALKHLALRTQSKALKTTINHIVRAMRIGGNLSDVMSDIAKDVSDEMKNKISAFSQKMNFFSVIFIFLGIVLPVAIMILGAIKNSPIAETGAALFKNVPLTPGVMIIFFFVAMPGIFVLLNLMIYVSQPRV